MAELFGMASQHLADLLFYRVDSAYALVLLFPFLLLLELPLTMVMVLGIIRRYLRLLHRTPASVGYRPRVSCIITCYGEGRDVLLTLQTLCEQIYPGEIELIPVVDGAAQNHATLAAVRSFSVDRQLYRNRIYRPIAKWQRGGRVSSLNAGLQAASGEIVLALDGDTSFDNNTVSALVRHFADPAVPAVSGSLRVRNATTSLATRLQELEYFISIHAGRTGLSEWNTVNNISGAFGAFRKEFLQQIGGWDTHSAEDLDLTLRIKSYFVRHRLRIPFEPQAVGHTDVPTSLRDFFRQRLRWDGDLYFLYVRKHWHSMTPRLLGWGNFLMIMLGGFLFQMVMPFMIVGYLFYAVLALPGHVSLALGMLVYLVYLAITLLMYLTGILLVSERPRRDLRMLAVIPLFPLFMMANRCWAVVCTLNEILRRGHEETGMAPWWVIKKGRRF